MVDFIESNYGIDKNDVDLLETYENAIEGDNNAWVTYKTTLATLNPTDPPFDFIDSTLMPKSTSIIWSLNLRCQYRLARQQHKILATAFNQRKVSLDFMGFGFRLLDCTEPQTTIPH